MLHFCWIPLFQMLPLLFQLTGRNNFCYAPARLLSQAQPSVFALATPLERPLIVPFLPLHLLKTSLNMLGAPELLLFGRLPGMPPGLALIQAVVVALIQGRQPAASSCWSFPSLHCSPWLEDHLCFLAAPLLPPPGEVMLVLFYRPCSRLTLHLPLIGSVVITARIWRLALIPSASVSAYTVQLLTLTLLLCCSGGCLPGAMPLHSWS